MDAKVSDNFVYKYEFIYALQMNLMEFCHDLLITCTFFNFKLICQSGLHVRSHRRSTKARRRGLYVSFSIFKTFRISAGNKIKETFSCYVRARKTRHFVLSSLKCMDIDSLEFLCILCT